MSCHYYGDKDQWSSNVSLGCLIAGILFQVKVPSYEVDTRDPPTQTAALTIVIASCLIIPPLALVASGDHTVTKWLGQTNISVANRHY